MALAAVLALEPPVLVLDEVMSQLDPTGKKRVAAVLQRLRGMGKAISFISNEQELHCHEHDIWWFCDWLSFLFFQVCIKNLNLWENMLEWSLKKFPRV
ncbi:MAG: hypothetical protein PHP51_05230 [Desulfotomaculaceae bacterium]|nr:hypothetical protein [Desulfotomaculaceae bacterium]MDD4767379.1 hypothetical protein [Desulfotomaculaceae bacterium]